LKSGFEPDTGIRVHERGVIAQLCSLFRSHEQGLPEWFKNASSAYARDNVPTEYRLLTLLTGNLGTGEGYVALLDHVGMSVEDLEGRFANWGDPEAHLAVEATEEIIEGGHGNGGKCYMTQMFESFSYLHTARNGRGSRYGFLGDDPRPGYFPTKTAGRGYPIEKASDELKRALLELGVDFARLPEEVRTAAAVRGGFTLVAGIGAKQLTGKDTARRLAESVLHHHQMALTVEKNRIYWIHDGKPVAGFTPVQLVDIVPHEYAPEPKVIAVPEELEDPVTRTMQKTTSAGSPQGQLILKTSKTSMRWGLKSRHHIRYVSRGRPVAFLQMEHVSRSTWVDRMYGECRLDMVSEFETPDRSTLAEAPMTRALENWIKEQVLEYEREFKRKDKLSASQEQRNRLQDLNNIFDQWKNRFLDDMNCGSGPAGAGTGRKGTRPRPLPQRKAIEAVVASAYSKAGVGVWLRMKVSFRDEDGLKVAAPAFLWHSSDWAVATVDENRVVTHAPGTTTIWLETIDANIRSNHVDITVLDTMSCRVEPDSIEVKAGSIAEVEAIVTERDGLEHRDVYMTWLQDDSSIVEVTTTGKIVGQKQGASKIYALDERTMNNAVGCDVTVRPAEILPGQKPGRSYPRILLSEVDADPLNPDGDTVHLSPEDGPVHQPTPQHVEHNIWWINLQCPLAKLYFEEFGSDSREWRSYHIERYIEALAKIRLSHDFQVADEDISFDEVERRWREVAAEVQRRAVEDLRPLLEGAE
jgi:hypothetical protein